MSIDLIKDWNPYKYAGLSLKDEWDLATFNLNFENNKISYQDAVKKQDEKVLDELNEISNKQDKESLKLYDFLIEWKSAFFSVINDLIHLKITKETIYQKNFLLYLGITIIIFSTFFYFLFSIHSLFSNEKNQQKIIHEHFYYRM